MIVNNFVNKQDGMGLGDFLRGSLACCQLYKSDKIPFAIDLRHHKINDYMDVKYDFEVCDASDIRDLQNIEPATIEGLKQNLLQDTSSLSETRRNIYTNIWPEFPIEQDIREYISSVFKPNADLLSDIKNVVPTQEEYEVVHIRAGDLLSYNFKIGDVIHYPLEELLEQLEQIEEIKQSTTRKLLVMSDSVELRNALAGKYDLLQPNTVPAHVAVESEKVKDTLIDFFILSKAKHIHQFSIHHWGSGFSESINWIYDVPITKYKLRAKQPAIHAFIFNWRGQYDSTLKIERELQKLTRRVTVINSDDDHKQKHWVNIGEGAYFGAQFARALELFNGDILLHVQGDTMYNDWSGFVNSMRQHYIDYEFGVYAPNINYTFWDAIKTDTRIFNKKCPSIREVSTTDSCCWAIDKTIVRKLKKNYIDAVRLNKYGHGIDISVCAISRLIRKTVLRDYSHTITHPKYTGYALSTAKEMQQKYIESFTVDIKDKILEICNNVGAEHACGVSIDPDFDEAYYLNTYPDIENWYIELCDSTQISDRQRLYHHYKLFGEREGRYKNSKEDNLCQFKVAVDRSFDAVYYQKTYPDIANYFIELGEQVSIKERLFHHYRLHGYAEGRHASAPKEFRDLKKITTPVPVFLHIPKNAGVYVNGYTRILCRNYVNGSTSGKNKPYQLYVMNKDRQVMTIFICDIYNTIATNNQYKVHKEDKYVLCVSLNNFLIDYLNAKEKPFIFSLTIEAAGVRLIKDGLLTFLETISGRKFQYYAVLRDIFSRQQSLYNYLTSSQSKHEPTHGAIKCNTFQEYIASPHYEGSWLVAMLSGASGKITQADYDSACRILDKFIIDSVKNVDKLINCVYKKCYNISLQDVGTLPAAQHHRSSYKESKVAFEDLDATTVKLFQEKTKYERLLYDRYIV